MYVVPECRQLSLTHCLCSRSASGGSDRLGGGQMVRMKGGPSLARLFHSLC